MISKLNKSSIRRFQLQCRQFMNYQAHSSSVPPSLFNNPKHIPEPYTQQSPSINNNSSSQVHSSELHASPAISSPSSPSAPAHPVTSTSPTTSPPFSNDERPLRDIGLFLAIGALAYFALDNYGNRMKLERLVKETTAINLKTLQIQQKNFLNARKQKDLQVLQERRDQNKRNFKMSLHIALLRKQLIEAGLTPIDIEKVVSEFEKNVKADNSIKNVSGQALWLDDSSPLKSHLPDPHDYDNKKVQGDSKK